MAEGWIKEYRSIREHWLWSDKPFARGQAFNDLLLMANHQDNKVMMNGELIEVKRGQRITSLRYLAETWGWSTKKVKTFLDVLQKEKMITYKSDTKKTVITIENWGLYQNEETPKKHERNAEETQEKHKGNTEEKQKKTNKNDKKEKNEKNDKNEGEGEENTLPSHSTGQDMTDIEKSIYNIVGNVGYGTWFKNAEISDSEDTIVIKTNDEFTEQIIKKNYLEQITTLLKKNVVIQGKEKNKIG